MAKIENTVLQSLQDQPGGLTITEISQKIGESEKKVFKALRKLFEQGEISTLNRRYRRVEK